jgi:predicted dehydrogenase
MAYKPLKVGVIGYAHYMRTNFVLHLKECSAVEIVGIYNRSEEPRKMAENDGFFATSSVDEFFKIPGLEAIIIGTANSTHSEFSIRAARQGIHVLCEKPMALNSADADKMTVEAEKAGIITHVNHMGPFMESFQILKKNAEDCCGKFLHVANRSSRTFGFWSQGARHQNVANPAASGGWTYHHFCHMLDEVCILLGTTRATKVYHIEQKSCPECPSEEIVNALVHFDNGATAFISDGLSIGGYHDIFVQGATGDARLHNNEVKITIPGPYERFLRPGSCSIFSKTLPVKAESKPIHTIANLFTQAVRGGKNELLSFRFVADQYRILDALRKSATTGQAVEPIYDN